MMLTITDKIVIAIVSLIVVFVIAASVSSCVEHKNCVCVKSKTRFNGKFYTIWCVEWEHHHKED